MRSGAGAERRTTFGGCFAYNFDYVICCALKRWTSFGQVSEENVFFSEGGKTIKMQASDEVRLPIFFNFLNVLFDFLFEIFEFGLVKIFQTS